jgi:hypothetical protein
MMSGDLDMALQCLGPDLTCPLFHDGERSDNTNDQLNSSALGIRARELTYSVPANPDFCSAALAFLSHIRAIIWTVFPRPMSYIVSYQAHYGRSETHIG